MNIEVVKPQTPCFFVGNLLTLFCSMKTSRQDRRQGSSRNSLFNSEAASASIPTSLAPPEMDLQASLQERNSNDHDQLNDALTSQYVPHPNDPLMWDQDLETKEYGPAVAGDFAVRGADDEAAMSVNDIHQGSIGNCHFLSALGAVVQTQPELIRNAINGPKADGTYDVTIWCHAGWDESREMQQYTFNMSSSFVVYQDQSDHPMRAVREWSGRDAFAHSGDRDQEGNEELWVKLIEKAFAIMSGGWEKVDGGYGGWAMLALEVLTGEPHREHYFNGVDPEDNIAQRPSGLDHHISTEEIRDTIVYHLEAGHAVTCADNGHSVTVIEADDDTITIRDQASATDNDQGYSTYTWEDFRNTYRKFVTRLEYN